MLSEDVAAMRYYIDEERIIKETALSMYRAGGDILITYFAMEIAQYIKEGTL